MIPAARRPGRRKRVLDGRVPRLDELLARNLGLSRTAARRLLAAGDVTDDAGLVLTEPRREVALAALPYPVMVEGERLELHHQVHLLLNKPTGCVTALRDDHHPTAYALLSGAPLFGELRAVGRLDLETTGLLLWTTDGQWLQRLTHPKRAVKRSYQAALARPFRADFAGLQLDDGHRPNIVALRSLTADQRHPSLLVPAETTQLAEIVLTGGAYHEVRRIFAALDSHVLGLCRVSFGPFALPRDLPPGSYRPVSPEPGSGPTAAYQGL
jgi:16S rRNA pseudouridine516 synthase